MEVFTLCFLLNAGILTVICGIKSPGALFREVMLILPAGTAEDI